jgi:nucleotide-binding universal stress UspA family protein
MLPLTKILCPTDFSEPSYEAVKIGKEWASHFKSTLILLHVVSPVPFVPEDPALVAPRMLTAEQGLSAYARKSLESLVEQLALKDLDVRLMVLEGNPADEIVRTAEEEEVEMIVIATHGRTGLNRLIFGSVAEKTIRLAGCPVLTICGQSSNESKGKISPE